MNIAEPSVWGVVIDGKRFELWDLSIEEAEEIAKRHSLGHWTDIVDGPMATLGLAKDLSEVAAKKLGVAVPILTSLRDVWSLFERGASDMPTESVDGNPKSVTDEDAPVTTG